MENSRFDSIKNELIVELSREEGNDSLSYEFRNKFYKLLDLCTFSMLNSGEDFFAYFLIQLKREVNVKLSSAAATKVTKEGFVIYFNPALFLQCTKSEMCALIKHEIYHIMSSHHSRARVLKAKYSSTVVDLAMDISINQYILNLPVWMETLERVKLSYDVDLEGNMAAEQYAALIQGAMNKFHKVKESENGVKEAEESNEDAEQPQNTHELWNQDEEFDEYMLKDIAKKLAVNASKGKMPESIEELMRKLNDRAEVTWKDYLKKFLGTLPAHHKKTITRRNRRQPERLDLRGRLSNHIVRLVIAIDISGSITDKEIEQIMTEVFALVKNYSHDVTIMECDSEIRRVYKAKNIKQIKKKINTRGNTKFTPVFEYMSENRMKDSLLIYFTDGLGEEELGMIPIQRNTIWVLTGKEEQLSLKKPYGVVKSLSNVQVKKVEFEYAPNAIKEFRRLEWSSF